MAISGCKRVISVVAGATTEGRQSASSAGAMRAVAVTLGRVELTLSKCFETRCVHSRLAKHGLIEELQQRLMARRVTRMALQLASCDSHRRTKSPSKPGPESRQTGELGRSISESTRGSRGGSQRQAKKE